MICEPGDVALVGFPFSDIKVVKVRPVVCLSIAEHNDVGETLVAMITTARESAWPDDIAIRHWSSAGLESPSVIRLKITSVMSERIVSRLGALGADDHAALRQALVRALALQT